MIRAINDNTMLVHNFRIDGEKHMVMCQHRKVKRNGSHVTLCALYVKEDAQHLTDRALINCFKCNRAFDGFIEAIDTDFGFPDPGDRHAIKIAPSRGPVYGLSRDGKQQL